MIEYTPKLPGTNHNISREHPLKGFFKVAIGTVVIVGGLYLILSIIAQFFAVHLPPSLERKMGKLWSCSDQKGYETIQQQFQKLINQLPEEAKKRFDYRVCITKKDTVNAGALPGGTILLFTGLLDKIKEPDGIAFVLAHELGHFYNKDHLRQLGRSVVGLTISTLIGFGGGDLAISGYTMEITNLSFSRDQEFAADRFAIKLMQKAGFNPRGGVVVMKRFREIFQKRLSFQYLESHPPPEARIQAMREMISKDIELSRNAR